MRIPLAGDGYRFIAPGVALTAAAAWLYWPVAVPLGVVTAFFILFFRDFERVTPNIAGAVFSAGDGRVDDIEEIDAPEFPGGRALKIGTFLSVFNCHITRSPVTGRVRKIQYQPGRFLNAMNRASGAQNESNRIEIETSAGPIVVRQIAGKIARRIVCTARTGQRLEAGQRIGLIRMGSRIEVYAPVTAELRVKKGATVRAGLSVLAVIK